MCFRELQTSFSGLQRRTRILSFGRRTEDGRLASVLRPPSLACELRSRRRRPAAEAARHLVKPVQGLPVDLRRRAVAVVVLARGPPRLVLERPPLRLLQRPLQEL